MSANILVVEDGPAEREALVRVLRMERYAVLSAENPQQAISHIDEPVDLVLSDLRMGQNSGLDLLRYWKGQRPGTPFIMVTAYGDIDSAVAAIKLGAKEYLTKPVDPDALLRLIDTCLAPRPAEPNSLPPDNLSGGIRDSAAAMPGPTPAGDRTLDEMERTVILRTLKEFDGNRTRTAEALGISVRTLQRRLKDWGVYDDPPEAE